MANRRALVAQLRREGKILEDIAANVGVSIATVHRDLEELRSQWRTRAAQDYDELVSAELEQLEAVRAEAWKGYSASINPLTPGGDPKMLELVRRTTADVIKLLGIDDPIAFNAKRVTDEGGDGQVDVLEIPVDSREELGDITDEHGNISLAAFKRRIVEEARNPPGAQTAAG